MGRNYDVPDNLRPLSMWTYFGLNILYAIPIVGTVFLIIHAISRKNINRRNFARSFFCVIIIALVIYLVAFGTAGIAGIVETIKTKLGL